MAVRVYPAHALLPLILCLLPATCRVEGSGLGSGQAVQVVAPVPGRPPPNLSGGGDGVGPSGEGSPPTEAERGRDAGPETDPNGPLDPPPPDADGGLAPPLTDAAPAADAADAPLPGIADLDRGLVLWLPLDDSIGAAAPRDGSGQNNRVRMQSIDTTTAWVPGRIGGALDLTSPANGMGHLRVDSSPSINRIGAELTVALWLSRAPGQTGVIVSRRASAAGGSLYRLEVLDGDQIRLVLNDRRGVRLNLRATSRLPAEPWVHVTVTSDEATARIYIAGSPAGSAVYGVPIATDVSPLIVGASEEAESGGLTGFLGARLDELLVYHRALSDIEVWALASGARPSDGDRDRRQ